MIRVIIGFPTYKSKPTNFFSPQKKEFIDHKFAKWATIHGIKLFRVLRKDQLDWKPVKIQFQINSKKWKRKLEKPSWWTKKRKWKISRKIEVIPCIGRLVKWKRTKIFSLTLFFKSMGIVRKIFLKSYGNLWVKLKNTFALPTYTFKIMGCGKIGK